MQILCGQCGRTLETDDADAQGQVVCPACGRSIEVKAFLAQGGSEAQDEVLPEEDDGFASQARQMMEKKVRVVCGACGRGLSVGIKMAGKQIRCPLCQGNLQVPGLEEEEERALAEVKLIGVDDDASSFNTSDLPRAEDETPPDEPPQAPPAPPVPESPATTILAAAVDKATPADSMETLDLPAARMGRQRIFIIAAAVVIVATAIVAYILTRGPGTAPNQPPTDQPPTPGPVAPTPSPAPSPTPAAGAATSEAVANPTPTPAPTATASAPAPKNVCMISATDRSIDYFASGGYYPARIGYVYLKLTVQLEVKSGHLEIHGYGDDVYLAATRAPAGQPPVQPPPEKIAALGTAQSSPLPPAVAERKAINLAQGQSQSLTFVFQVPEDIQKAKLTIVDADEVDLGNISVPAGSPPQAIAGKWEEAAPRNLKPALADPVMAALQSAAPGPMTIQPVKDGFQLAIPNADVRGSFKPEGGVYKGTLSVEGHALPCRIRLIDHGKRLIIYLSDQPFHQVTYKLTKA